MIFFLILYHADFFLDFMVFRMIKFFFKKTLFSLKLIIKINIFFKYIYILFYTTFSLFKDE